MLFNYTVWFALDFYLHKINCLLHFGNVYSNIGDLSKVKGYFDQAYMIWKDYETCKSKTMIQLSNDQINSWLAIEGKIYNNLAVFYQKKW